MSMTRSTKMASVDLETMATTADAVVVQVGIVTFSLEGGIIDKLKLNISAREQVRRKIDAETVLWWLRQSQEARDSLQTPAPFGVHHAVTTIEAMLSDCDYVWARGPQFDLSILNSLHRSVRSEYVADMIEWWKWRDERPLRDLLRLHNLELPRTEVEHDALEDAIYQARTIIAALSL